MLEQIWCVEKFMVPRLATILAKIKKPMRIKTCSTAAEEPTLMTELKFLRSGRKLSLKDKYKNPSDLRTEIRAIREATT